MHIKTRQLAYLGMMAAFSVVLMLLANMIEVNTMFFLAAASFLVGAATAMTGPGKGTVFFLVCLVLSFILLPNKLYCFTYGAFGIYILVREIVRAHIRKVPLQWGIRYVVFNLFFIPILIFVPELLVARKIEGIVFVLILAGGQILLFIMDTAYEWFMRYVWTPFYKKLTLTM